MADSLRLFALFWARLSHIATLALAWVCGHANVEDFTPILRKKKHFFHASAANVCEATPIYGQCGFGPADCQLLRLRTPRRAWHVKYPRHNVCPPPKKWVRGPLPTTAVGGACRQVCYANTCEGRARLLLQVARDRLTETPRTFLAARLAATVSVCHPLLPAAPPRALLLPPLTPAPGGRGRAGRLAGRRLPDRPGCRHSWRWWRRRARRGTVLRRPLKAV